MRSRPHKKKLALLLLGMLLPVLCGNDLHAQSTQRKDSLLQQLKHGTRDSLYVNVLNELAYEYAPDESKRALVYARKALGLSQKTGFVKGQARACSNIGLCYDYTGQSDSALHWYNRAVELNLQTGDRNGLAGNYLNIGGSYLYHGLYKPALENTVKAYELYASLGNQKRMVSALNNMGIIYRSTKAYDRALANYNEVLRIRKRYNDERGLMVAYTNTGVVYQNLGDYKNFLAYSDTALQLARKVGNTNDVAGSVLNRGLACIRVNRFAEARTLLNESLQLTLKNNDKGNLAYTYAAMGELEAHQGKAAKAVDWYKKALSLSHNLKLRELRMALYGYLYLSYKKLGRFEDAMFYLEYEKALSDSLLGDEIMRQTREIDAIYQTAEKEKENQQLRNENNVQKLSTGWAHTQRNIFIWVSIVVVLLLLLLLRAYMHNRKANRLLRQNKKIIEQSLSEKETLLKEVHHRVKNNLQIISSLLELQLNRISDENIISLLKESKNRIESMALIHKKLYTHNNFSAIDAQGYIHDLVQALRVSYLPSGYKLEIVYRIEKTVIDTETAVPLGLILTEVVSNAFKHAVSDKQDNFLSIYLDRQGAGFVLTVHDNGPGINNIDELFETGSLGLKLVKILSRQLEGEAVFMNQNGLHFKLCGKITG